MAGIPQNFQSISPVIANYNFVDIASGTGYVEFFGGNTVDLNILSNFDYFSDRIVTTFAVGDVAFTKAIDVDYDTLLNRPLDVKGLGIVNIGVFGLSNQVQLYVIAILRKWTGAVETDIVSNQSRTFASGGSEYTMLSIDLNAPLTHFKVGEYLRLTIEIWEKTTGAASSGTYAHDPKNRTTGWDASGAVPSQLLFQCPVRLNL
jgi:hypothetical protein